MTFLATISFQFSGRTPSLELRRREVVVGSALDSRLRWGLGSRLAFIGGCCIIRCVGMRFAWQKVLLATLEQFDEAVLVRLAEQFNEASIACAYSTFIHHDLETAAEGSSSDDRAFLFPRLCDQILYSHPIADFESRGCVAVALLRVVDVRQGGHVGPDRPAEEELRRARVLAVSWGGIEFK